MNAPHFQKVFAGLCVISLLLIMTAGFMLLFGAPGNASAAVLVTGLLLPVIPDLLLSSENARIRRNLHRVPVSSGSRTR